MVPGFAHEIICFVTKSIHLLNGHVVNVLQEINRSDTNKLYSEGSIQIQSEGAEVDYRQIEIKSVPATVCKVIDRFERQGHEALGMEMPLNQHNFQAKLFPEKVRKYDYPSFMKVMKVTQNGAMRWAFYYWIYHKHW